METVIFDFFGVIARPRSIYETIASLCGKDIPTVGPVYRQYEAGKISRADFWESMGLKKHEYERVESQMAHHFHIDPDFHRVHDIVTESYDTGIISNADSITIRHLLRHFGLDDAFDAIIVSEEVNAVKPEIRIYKKFMDMLDAEAEDCVFIDDRLENLDTADGLGMTTVHHLIDDDDYDFEPDYTVERLTELLEILDVE